MMKKVFLTFSLFIYTIIGFSQSSNFIAQGHYYKAKELYEAKSCSAALPYVVKSKETLKGTNFQLQYLHIMILVCMEDWIAANNELKKYFTLEDNTDLAIGFSKTVERLTNDETKQLTKVLVDIQENSESQEGQVNAKKSKEKLEKEITFELNKLLSVLNRPNQKRECIGCSNGIKYRLIQNEIFISNTTIYYKNTLNNYNPDATKHSSYELKANTSFCNIRGIKYINYNNYSVVEFIFIYKIKENGIANIYNSTNTYSDLSQSRSFETLLNQNEIVLLTKINSLLADYHALCSN